MEDDTPKSIEKKNNNQQQIQLKLSTIFKQKKVIDTPQAFGSFYDANGEKYCAISVLSKYLGYDIAAVSNNDKKDTNPVELIPNAILEMIEDFALHSNHQGSVKCSCSKP